MCSKITIFRYHEALSMDCATRIKRGQNFLKWYWRYTHRDVGRWALFYILQRGHVAISTKCFSASLTKIFKNQEVVQIACSTT